MDDTCTTLAFDREPDEDGDCRQVVCYEVRSAIKWVYPDDSIFGIKGLKGLYRALNLIQFIVWPQDFVDEALPLFVLCVQGLHFDEVTDLVVNQVRVNTWLYTLKALLGLFALYSQGWVKVLQADFKSLLHAKIGDSHGIIHTFIFPLMVSGLLHLSNDLATLL